MAALTRKIFTDFVLPVGLRNGDWTPGDERLQAWSKNLIADIQTSRIIRHVLREENARGRLDHNHLNSPRSYYFRDNNKYVADDEEYASA